MELSVFHYEDYREYLRQVLGFRKQLDKKYSLRTFSRELGLIPSRLSNVLNNRYGLSVKAAKELSSKLFSDFFEKTYFCLLVEKETRSEKSEIQKIKSELRNLRKLRERYSENHEDFGAIDSYHYYALMELTYLNNYRWDKKWIAEKMDIDEEKLDHLIQVLKSGKLIKPDSHEIIPVSDNTYSYNESLSIELKKTLLSVLDKGKLSLSETEPEERNCAYHILSFNHSRLEEAKNFVRKFRAEFDAKFGHDLDRDCVYALTTNLFPIIKKEKKNKRELR